MTDFEQIYKDYFRDVFLYVRRLSGGDERLAEDITSEAFFRALRRIDSFRGDCDIRVWLCQIAKNCYYTHLKQSRWTEHTADRGKPAHRRPEAGRYLRRRRAVFPPALPPFSLYTREFPPFVGSGAVHSGSLYLMPWRFGR